MADADLRNVTILVAVALYMILCVAIGFWAMNRTKSTKDFFMAGRNIGVVVTGLAIFSSTLSGFGFVGGPGLVYMMGMSSVWMIVCAGIGMCISYYLNGKRLRVFAEYYDCITLPSMVEHRYDSKTTRVLVAVAILLGVMGYMATQIMAMAMVMVSLFQDIEMLQNIGFVTCAIVATSFLVFYCVTGGILASLYTDVVQGGIMMVSAVLIFVTAIFIFAGGPTETVTTIFQDDSEVVNAFGTFGMMGCLSWFLLFGLGGAGQPHVISKLMMSRNIKDSKQSLPVAFLTYSVAALLWISLGLVMRALVISGQHPELANPDAAAAQFLQFYAHPVLAGIVFAALFAAIMSTADAFLNIGSAALIHDIPMAITGRKLNNELVWARWATVLIAGLAAGLAIYSHKISGELVGLLGAFGWSTFAAALFPVVAIGFNWKRASTLAANVAIISSLAINIFFKMVAVKLPFGFDSGAFSVLVSLVLFLGISYLGPQKELRPELKALIEV